MAKKKTKKQAKRKKRWVCKETSRTITRKGPEIYVVIRGRCIKR